MAEFRLNQEEKERIPTIMRVLDLTYEEAVDLLKCDRAIDKGEHMDFDISKEQEKEVRKMLKHETMSGARTFEKRPKQPKEKKVNEPKKAFIEDLVAWLGESEDYGNIEVVNAERQVKFTIGEDTFELTLVQKRKPKN